MAEDPFLAFPRILKLSASYPFFKFVGKPETGLLATQIKFWDHFIINTFVQFILKSGLRIALGPTESIFNRPGVAGAVL